MKKNLSWTEQVQAAKKEVESWPESVKSATDFRYSDFFHSADESSCSTSRCDEQHYAATCKL